MAKEKLEEIIKKCSDDPSIVFKAAARAMAMEVVGKAVMSRENGNAAAKQFEETVKKSANTAKQYGAMASKAADQTIRAGANAAQTYGTYAAKATQQATSAGAKKVGTILKNEAKAMVPRLGKVATGAGLMTGLGFIEAIIDNISKNEDKIRKTIENNSQTHAKRLDSNTEKFSQDSFTLFIEKNEAKASVKQNFDLFTSEAEKLSKNLSESFKNNLSLFERKNISLDTHPAVQSLSSAPLTISLASITSTVTGNPKIGATVKTIIDTVTETVPKQIWSLTYNTGYYYGDVLYKSLTKAEQNASKKNSYMKDVEAIKKSLNGQVIKGDNDMTIAPSPNIPRIINSESGRGK